eukprot:3727827-Prorocentrum_lima.AAC.1
MLPEGYNRDHLNSQRRVDITEERPQSVQARIWAGTREAEEQMEHEHPQVVHALEETALSDHNAL